MDDSPRWPQLPQTHNDWSSKHGSEPATLEADGYRWHYMLLAVKASNNHDDDDNALYILHKSNHISHLQQYLYALRCQLRRLLQLLPSVLPVTVPLSKYVTSANEERSPDHTHHNVERTSITYLLSLTPDKRWTVSNDASKPDFMWPWPVTSWCQKLIVSCPCPVNHLCQFEAKNRDNMVTRGNALASINVVALRQTRLVPGWVTICGRVNHLGM